MTDDLTPLSAEQITEALVRHIEADCPATDEALSYDELYALARSCVGFFYNLVAHRLGVSRSPDGQAGPGRDDLEYAQRLATFAAGKFGPPDGWKPLDDMWGVLSQIDNALTGLVAAPSPPPATEWEGEKPTSDSEREVG